MRRTAAGQAGEERRAGRRRTLGAIKRGIRVFDAPPTGGKPTIGKSDAGVGAEHVMTRQIVEPRGRGKRTPA